MLPSARWPSRRTDLALTGESFEHERKPIRTHQVQVAVVASYLGETDPKILWRPRCTVICAPAPIRVHVGDDEVLLDDSRRYVERAVAAGVDAALDVWMGMPHDSSPM